MNKKESEFQFTNPKIAELLFAPSGNDNSSALEDIIPTIVVQSDVKRRMNENEATVVLTVSNFKKEDLDSEAEYEPPYLLRIAYTADFKWPESLEDDEVDGFLKVNAQALLFAYVRPQVSEITSRAGFDTINLPFLDFTNSASE